MKRMKYNNGGGATYVKNIGNLETKSNIHLQGAKTEFKYPLSKGIDIRHEVARDFNTGQNRRKTSVGNNVFRLEKSKNYVGLKVQKNF